MAKKDKQSTALPGAVSDATLDSILSAFVIAPNEQLVRYKLAAIRSSTTPPELWADFDNTLTVRKFGIWEALRDALPPAGREESDEERYRNLAKEHAGILSVEENIEWTKHEISRYAHYGVTIADLMKAVESVRLRTGAQRLFALCDKMNIPRHIVSASVADAIEYVGVHPARIHSNKLHIKDGIVIGWDEAHMLHNQNKHLHTRVILAEADDHSSIGWKIVMGDTRYDADMIPGDSPLRIRVKGRKGNTAAYLSESFSISENCSGYDLVLKRESLLPVVRLLRWL